MNITNSKNRNITRSQDADPCIFTRDYDVPLRIHRKYAVAGAVGSPLDADLARIGVDWRGLAWIDVLVFFRRAVAFLQKSEVLPCEYQGF